MSQEKKNGLEYAEATGDNKIIELMKKPTNANRSIAFIIACCKGYNDFCRYALKDGIYDIDKGLEFACRNGNQETIKLLFNEFARINIKSRIRKTLLHLIAENRYDILKYLIGNDYVELYYIYYICPERKKMMVELLSLGLNIEKFNKIPHFDKLLNDIQKFKTEISLTANKYINKDLVNIIVDYSVL